MEPRGLMGGLYRISEWIMRLSFINILWIVCALPFFYFFGSGILSVLNGLVPEEELLDFIKSWAILLGVLAPFTFFPSTAAMFTVARKWVTGEADVPLFKTFFKGYKENFKQSLLGGLIYALIIVILVIDYFVYREQISFVAYIFITFLVLVVISLFNFFSMIVHYRMTTFQLIKNAMLLTLGKPVRSFTTLIMSGVVLYVSFFQFQWLLMFFTGSIIAFLAYWNFNIIYIKLQEQVENMKKSEEVEPEIAAEMDREDLVKTDEPSSK